MNNFYNWKNADILTKFIAINLGFFLVATVVNIFSFLFSSKLILHFTNFFAVHANLKKLLFHFWTPLTYMFFHTNFFHFVFNMIMLYFMGRIFLSYFDEDKFVAVYLIGGLVGALFFIVSYNIFPGLDASHSIALGASASITAIIFAIALYQPRLEVYLFGIFRMQLIWLAILLFLMDLAFIPSGNAGGHIAHIGGAFYGIWFAQAVKKGKDITIGFSSLWRKIFTKRKFKVHFNMETRDDYEFNYNREQIRKEIDRILEKISKKGYDALSKKEKEFLKKYKDFI